MLIKQRQVYYSATSFPLQTVSQVWNMHSRRTGSLDRLLFRAGITQIPGADHTASLLESWFLPGKSQLGVGLDSRLTFPQLLLAG